MPPRPPLHSVRPNSVSRTVRPRLVGRLDSAVAAVLVAVASALVTYQRVAATDSYLRIQHAVPTYDGSAGPTFVLGAGALVAFALVASYLDAGVVPAVILAAGPVFGWALTHFTSPITPHYAATFPLEMAVLYGGVFGVVGYLLGAALRRVAPLSKFATVSRD